ncbi:MAG: hypothetical protein FWD06_03980 [Oscillospiraceae bacterium]|nr:hypothetical protein [Oscillospiraceae bacterium]
MSTEQIMFDLKKKLGTVVSGLTQIAGGLGLNVDAETIKMDINQFCCYLMCFEQSEMPLKTGFYNFMFDENLTQDALLGRINSNTDLLVKRYEGMENPFISMTIAIASDQIKRGILSELTFEFISQVGTTLLACGDFNKSAFLKYSEITSRVRKYAEQQLGTFSLPLCSTQSMTPPKTETEPQEKPPTTDERPKVSLEDTLAKLEGLVGLNSVKKDVNGLINLLKIREMRKSRGLSNDDMSLHLVFSGNPGTGKTTVARILAGIYCELGVLSQGQLIEVDRVGLVGGYVG